MLKLSDKIPKKYSNQKGDPSEETIDIDLQGVGLHKVYDWLPYTFFRVQRMLDEIGCYAENIWQGYKANRRLGYCEHYRIRRKEDGAIINEEIDLCGLQKFFAAHDFPLEDEKTLRKKPPKTGRNPEAEAFLEQVRKRM